MIKTLMGFCFHLFNKRVWQIFYPSINEKELDLDIKTTLEEQYHRNTRGL